MKILVGLTQAPEALAALHRAVEEARLRGAELLILDYVRVGPSTGDPAERFRAAERQLERAQRRLEDQGLRVRTRSALGVRAASSELLRVAEEEQVDLIVIGIRRRSPVGKLVLGSTAQEVLLGATAPVLAVKHAGASGHGGAAR